MQQDGCMRFLIFLLFPVFAFADDEARISAARDLAHGHSIKDQAIVGNALVTLKDLACRGDYKASALLGRKYFSGRDEFEKNDDQAEIFLRYAAEFGEGDAVIDLVLLMTAKPPSFETINSADKWLRVGAYLKKARSVPVQLAGNAIDLRRAEHPEILVSADKNQLDAALTIHRIRNNLHESITTPCASSRKG
jgi:TPR repeat protein